MERSLVRKVPPQWALWRAKAIRHTCSTPSVTSTTMLRVLTRQQWWVHNIWVSIWTSHQEWRVRISRCSRHNTLSLLSSAILSHHPWAPKLPPLLTLIFQPIWPLMPMEVSNFNSSLQMRTAQVVLLVAQRLKVNRLWKRAMSLIETTRMNELSQDSRPGVKCKIPNS